MAFVDRNRVEKKMERVKLCYLCSSTQGMSVLSKNVNLTFEASTGLSLINHLRAAAGLDLLEVQLTETTSPALFVDLWP